jgi:hypothetical protein
MKCILDGMAIPCYDHRPRTPGGGHRRNRVAPLLNQGDNGAKYNPIFRMTPPAKGIMAAWSNSSGKGA